MLEICKMYGWDYWTFHAQPLWFIRLAIEKLKIDSKKAQAAAVDPKNPRQ